MSWDTSQRRAQLPSNWGSIRAAVLERDQHRCHADRHDPRCDGTANEVNHLGAPDDHALEQLRAENHWCHLAHTLARAAAARAARPKRERPAERHPGLL